MKQASEGDLLANRLARASLGRGRLRLLLPFVAVGQQVGVGHRPTDPSGSLTLGLLERAEARRGRRR
eukprot:1922768-Prymnesium_polylepis.1